jgi:putative hydroxymethylpyrimidine transporter CytX
MIIGGARAAGVIVNPALHTQGEALWCVVIGALIVLWLLVDIKNLGKLNLFAMAALFVTTIMLSTVIFRGGSPASGAGTMSFGAAVELAAAMPLSWLPLISDYVKTAWKPKQAALVSTSVYFATSCWMYVIGLGAAILTGESDIAKILLQAGLGLAGVFIVIFSTVTTTFLDAYSAGISFNTVVRKADGKWTAVIVCVVGTLLAIFTPIEQYQNFLYLIGSVFAPMIAILVTDFFILKEDHTREPFGITNLVLWVIGFAIYRLSMSMDTFVGSTLPVMIIISILSILINGGKKIVRRNH